MAPTQLELNFDPPTTPDEEEVWHQYENNQLAKMRIEAIKQSVMFISSMSKEELAMLTMRRVFEIGYLQGLAKGGGIK
jgi:hypothetical protein